MEKELANFLKYFADEDYEIGRRWARALLGQKDKEILSKVLQFEDNPSLLTSDYIEALSPECRIVAFADLYFDARVQIETSYNYRRACRKIEAAKPLLDCMEEEACPILMGVIKHVCSFQQDLCEIDRSLYADNPEKLVIPCEGLLTSVANAKRAAIGIYAPWKDLYETFLLPSIEANKLFADSMILLAEAHQSKWMRGKEEANFKDIENRISNYIDHLRLNGAEIQATEILPSLRSYLEFVANKKDHHPLIIQNAKTKITYFAIMEPCLMPVVASAIEDELLQKGKPAIWLGDIKCSQPDIESLSDIWKSVVNETSPHEYRWALSDMVIDPQNKAISTQVDLVYSKLGFWRVEFTAHISDFTSSEFKQVGVLGTPYSLDNNLQLQAHSGITKQYAFISDFVEELFSNLEICLRRYQEDEKLSIYGSKTLEWALDRNWFALESLFRIESQNQKGKSLTAGEFASSLSYKELALPSREVRSALGSWIFRNPPTQDKNLAPIRYNNDEVIFVTRNHAFTALLEQPDWVNYQAMDSLLLCAAITHMVDLTAQKITLNESQFGKNVEGLTSQELKDDISSIELLETHIDHILSIIKGGNIMTYADHSEFIEACLVEFNLYKTQLHLDHVLQSSKSKRELRVLEIERRHKKWIKRAITIGTAFLTIGAVGEVLQILDDMDLMGRTFAPKVQLTFLGICFSLVIIVGFISSNKTDN